MVGNVIHLKMPKQKPIPGSLDSKGKTEINIDAIPVRHVFCYSSGTHASTIIMPTWMPPSPSPNTTAAPSNRQISSHLSIPSAIIGLVNITDRETQGAKGVIKKVIYRPNYCLFQPYLNSQSPAEKWEYW